MGDVRFLPAYRLVSEAKDRSIAIRRLDDEALIAALAGTVMVRDEYLANVLATEGQNRARLAARAMDAVPAAIVTLSPMGRVVAMNLRAREMLGDFIGHDLSSLLADARAARSMDAFLDLSCGRHDADLRAGSGRVFAAQLDASPVEDEHGARIGTMLVVRDDADWDVPRRTGAIAFGSSAWPNEPSISLTR